MKKELLYLLVSVIICSGCNHTQQKSQSKIIAHPNDTAQPLTSINVYYPNVQRVQQPNENGCWAAALTMLYSYKMGEQDLTILGILTPLGQQYVDIFKANTGIDPSSEASLYSKVPLTVIQGQNPTIDDWADILQKHGPLSVTVKPRPGYHAIVVTGFNGDGTADNTQVYYIDPADAQEHEVAFSDFLKLYEGASNWPLQIIYWPDINSAVKVKK